MLLRAGILALTLSAPIGVQAQPAPVIPAAEPAKVERITLWRQAGVTSLALANGVDIHMRQMARPGTGRVTIAVLVPGLELDETAATRGTAMLAIDALKPVPGGGEASLKVAQRPEGLLITTSCSTNEAVAAVRQIAATLAAPALDPAAFERARERALTQSDTFVHRADHKASEAMIRLMTPSEDVRLRHPTRANLEAVKPHDAETYLRAHLSSRAVDVAVVGDVDPAKLGPALAAELASLPPRRRDRLTELRAIQRQVVAPGQADIVAHGPRAMLAISLPAPAIADLADARVASITARLMERRVADALRESGLKVSLASGVAMTGRTYPSLGAVIGSFLLTGDEPRLTAASGVARSALLKLIEDGPTSAQLSRAVDDAADEVGRRIDSADYWSQSLAMAWFLRVPIDELGTAPAAFKAVTAQQVRAHTQRWWKPEQSLTVTILPPPAPPADPVDPRP